MTLDVPCAKRVPHRPRGRLTRRSADVTALSGTLRRLRKLRAAVAAYLRTLQAAFARLGEWGGDDAPACLLLFPGDFPILDRPLPRFLDDAAAAKLLRAARDETDPFARLCVEFLARTGLRRGEFVDLTVDAVVRIGSAF